MGGLAAHTPVAEVASLGAAEAIQGMLAAEGVPATVKVEASAGLVPTRVRVYVSAQLAHRARWILDGSDCTERELVYLATGELAPEEE